MFYTVTTNNAYATYNPFHFLQTHFPFLKALILQLKADGLKLYQKLDTAKKENLTDTVLNTILKEIVSSYSTQPDGKMVAVQYFLREIKSRLVNCFIRRPFVSICSDKRLV